MKTIERLDFPLRVYSGNNEYCEHSSAVIVFTHGAPAYVRASGPFAIYTWEHVERITGAADKDQEPALTERLRASVAAIADERNGAKQDAMRLGTLLVSVVEKVSAAFGCRNQDPQDPETAVDLAERVKLLRSENARLNTLHTEHRLALRAALGLRDDEANDNATDDFKALCERVASLRSNYESAYRVAHINADDAHRLSNATANLKADLASVTEQRDVLKRQLEELRAETRRPPRRQIGPTFEEQVKAFSENNPPDEEHRLALQDRDKPPPGFDVVRLPRALRMTIETAGVWGPNALAEAWRLHEEARSSALMQPKQVEPGGPIWVRVVDTSSKRFGLVGRLVAIEEEADSEEQRWHVELEGGLSVLGVPTRFAVIGTGRQGPGPNEAPKPDTEHQQAQNRDKWRATCLANGAKDCTVYFGPGDEVTFVVELQRPCQSAAKALDAMRQALLKEHGLHVNNYRLREVRPLVDGVNS